MAKDDKMARDIRNTLRKTFGASGKYATGTAKLFLASGKEYFANEMPVPVAMWETNKDILTEFWRSLRNPSDAANRYGNRISEMESYKELKKFTKNALDDLKSGKLYDKDRDRSSWGMEIDNLMDNFGGFDMTGFDENGDWSEDNTGFDEIDAQIKVAEAQENGAIRRTEATIDAISTGTEAVVRNQQAIASNELRIGMKQHSQLMTAMQNMITQQATSVEMQAKSINALLDVTREAHNQMLESFNKTNDILTEIRDILKPQEERKQYNNGYEPFGINGEINLKEYVKNIGKNFKDKFTYGNGLGMFTGGFSVAQILDNLQNNPLQLITDLIVPKLIPKDVKAQMARTNQNLGSFIPALLTKAADRGRRFERGESNKISDMLFGLFGVEQKSANRIYTERDEYLKAAKFTDKTTRAIEEVIPTLLAKIDSSLTGGPLMIYDYKQGKFVKATSIVARTMYEANDLAGRGGETTWKIIERARKMPFKTQEDSDNFQKYVYDFLQKIAEESRFIGKNTSQADFMKMMPDVSVDVNSAEYARNHWTAEEKKASYYRRLKAIYDNLDDKDLIAISKNMLDARARRDRDVFDLNQSIHDTGRGAAFSGLLDSTLQDLIESKTKHKYGGLTDADIDNITENRRKDIIKAGGTKASNLILNDILNTLRGGIVTYSYHMGWISKPSFAEDKSIISTQAKNVIYKLNQQQKDEQDKANAIREEARRKEEDLMRQFSEANAKAADGSVNYSDDLSTLNEIQKAIQIDEYDPDDPKLKEVKNLQNKYHRYGEFAEKFLDKGKGKISRGSKLAEKFQKLARTPFDLFNKSLQITDALMMKALYGTDMDNIQLWKDKENEPFMLKTLTTAVEAHFKNAKDWFVENIGNPVKNYFFNKEDGLLPKLKESAFDLLDVDEKKAWVKNKYKEYRDKAVTKLRGTKNESGLYEGGLFSTQFNQMNEIKAGVKGAAYTTIQTSLNRLLYGDYASTKGISAEYYFKGDDGKMHTGGKVGYHGVIGRLKQGFQGLQNLLFGEEDNPDNPTESRRKFNFVKGELSKAFPNMVVGAGAGVLASLLLPGGPLLGAIIGSSLGLVKSSESLKQFLFGDSIEEDDTYIDPFTGKKVQRLGPDGKPIKKKTRKGNLISQDVYEGFKKFAPKVTAGAIVGTIAGGLGLLPLGLGSTAGMVVGSMAGMIGASDQMKQLIFGKEGDDDSGLISKNFRKSVVDWAKKNLPTTMAGALAGTASWGLISSVGLIPGLAMLPGGPILGFLGASVGLANGDNIKDFFFGESEVVTDPETGEKKVVRQGGVFGKAFDSVRDKIMNPIARSFNFAGEKTKDWFQTNIIDTMKRTVDPMKDALANAGKEIEHAMKNIGNGIVEALFGRLDDIDSPRYKFHKFWNEKIMDKLKSLPNKIFGGIGKAIGFVLSSPFKAAEFIFTGKIGGKTLEQRRVEKGFRKRHKAEVKSGQYGYIEGEDSEWGILNAINRAKRGLGSAFTTYSPDAMQLINSGQSLNEILDSGMIDYYDPDGSAGLSDEIYKYFGRKEDDANRHKTRSAKAKLLHDLEGRVNKQQKLGLLPGQAVKGYMTDQDYMRGLGFDDRIVNTDWAKRNISIDTFLKEGGMPDVKSYQAWVKSKIDDEKKKFNTKRKRNARDVKWKEDEERWALNALNRRRARQNLPPVENLRDFDEATSILAKNQGKVVDPETGELVDPKKKHWYDGITGAFKADHIGPNRNESWIDSFTGYLDQYGSDESFMERMPKNTTKSKPKQNKQTSTPTKPKNTVPVVKTLDPKNPEAVVVKIVDSQIKDIAGSNKNNPINNTALGDVINEGSEPKTSALPESVAAKNAIVKQRLASRRAISTTGLPEQTKRAVKEQQREEDRKIQKEFKEEKAGYLEADRATEGKKTHEAANDALDKFISKTQSPSKFRGALSAFMANKAGGTGELSDKVNEDKESWWDKLLSWLPFAGGILATIGAGITSIISLVGGIGAAIGAFASGATDTALHGVEVLTQGFLKRFGFKTMKGATFENVGKAFTNASATRQASKDFAKASSESVTRRAARRNMATARGLNRVARWADFFEAATLAAKGDKAGLARIAEDAAENGILGGLGMRMRQGLGKAAGTVARGINTGATGAFAGLGRFAEGFDSAAKAAASGNTAKVEAMRNVNKKFSYGKYGTKTRGAGLAAGEKVGQAFKTVKDAFIKTLEKFFNLSAIKSSKFGKFSAKIISAIKNMKIWSAIKTKFLSMGGKEAAAKIALKELHVVPVLTLGFALADFSIGQAKAREYFGVFYGDVTEGMRFTSGIVNCLEGLIAAIPVPPLIPALVSVALSFFTGDIAQEVYAAIADDDAKAELKQNQEALQQATDQYNKENGTELTTGEYAKNYNEDGTKKSKMDKVNDVISAVFGVSNSTDIANSAKYSHAALGGKGRGLGKLYWGAGSKVRAMSQHDPRFNKTNRVMADAGCGPTVGAMVASAYGVDLNPEQLSKDSFASGMRASDGGMNPQYFSQMAGKYGSGFGMAQGPVDGARISSNLAKGQPVVMMGKGGPYGPTTHYMVAEGLTGRGGVRMIDPNNGSRKTVSGNALIKNSTASVYSWGRGKAELDKIKRAYKPNRQTIASVWGSGNGTDNLPESDMDVDDRMDTKINNEEPNVLFGKGKGKWGKGAIDALKTAASNASDNISKAKVKEVMAEWNDWNSTGTGGWAAWRNWPGNGRYHAGIDLHYAKGKVSGAPVKSFTSGVVEKICSTPSSARGLYVVVKDEGGYHHIYQHLNSVKASVGQQVGIGQVVGGYGGSGTSLNQYGLHLHYEVRRPNAPSVTGGGVKGYMTTREMLDQYCIDPRVRLAEYSGGKVATGDGTTTDADGFSGSSGSVDSTKPKGVQFLSAVSDMFTKFSSPFTTLLGKILNQDTEDDSSSDSSGGTSTSISGPTGTTLDNAKYVYKWMKQFGVPDINIAGMLGNWTKESGIDPTGVEGIYDEPFQVGPKKQAAMADPQNYVWNSLKPRTHIKVNWGAYKGRDGVYYPGIGLGGFTGPATTDVLDIAKKNGTNWYDLETQLHYVTDPGGYRGGSTWIDKWKNKTFSSAAESADWFTKNWEGITPSAAVKSSERRSIAQDYLNQFATWGTESSGGTISGVKDAIGNKIVDLVGSGTTGSGVGIYGAGPGLDDSYNVKSMASSVKNWNKVLQKNNTVTDISNGFNNISQLARKSDGSSKETDNTTAQILSFLTENIGTLIQYVSTIADRMPVQRRTTDVQNNINGTRNNTLPTVNASNMYAPTPTGGNSEDVGMRIMNSLTSK